MSDVTLITTDRTLNLLGLPELVRDKILQHLIRRDTIAVDNSSFKEFDPTNKMWKRRNFLILGKRASGKTTMCRNLINQRGLFGNKLIVNHCESITHDYADIANNNQILEEYDTNGIINLMYLQRQNHRTSTTPAVVLIDDLLNDGRSLSKDSNFNRLMMVSRHYSCDIIISLASFVSFPPQWRSNFDYIFIGSNFDKNSIRKIWEQYGGVISSFDIFQSILNKIIGSEPYTFLVIDNTSNSDKLEDVIFWYKVDLLKNKNN